ncbi:MAG: saccharopine dehydrogenase family protein [Anaerolineae bacterium]
MRILLLGTGLQGKAALHDLARSPFVSRVIAGDADIGGLTAYADRLETDKITCVELDAYNHDQVAGLMQSAQVVIALLPTAFHVSIAQLALACGVHLVSASYAPREFQAIGREAEAKGLAILPEFGLDPGIDLVLAGQAIRELDEVHEFYSYGAGVPEPNVANNPIKYKVSWTFEGVLKSYRHPARILRHSHTVDISDKEIFAEENIHMVKIEGLGPLEAFPNGDVVKYLNAMGTSPTVRNAGRYTMRWPGHCAFWKQLVDLGFLDEAPIRVGDDVTISPRRFVHDLLVPQLQYQDDERDVTVVRIDTRGIKNGRRKRVIYQVIDWRDLDTGLLAMQRTVGYTTSIGAQMILRGDIQQRGLLSPIKDVPAGIFLDELRQRGIAVQRKEGDWKG